MFVQPRVVGQLRMERRHEEPPLAREHRPAVDLGEHLDAGPDVLDPRRPDEDGAHRLGLPFDVEIGLERRDLAAERVAPHRQIDESEVVAVEHDHPGARAEDRTVEALTASSSPYRRISRVNVVDSPPGITSPSRSSNWSALRTSTASTRAGGASARARESCPARRERRSEAAAWRQWYHARQARVRIRRRPSARHGPAKTRRSRCASVSATAKRRCPPARSAGNSSNETCHAFTGSRRAPPR